MIWLAGQTRKLGAGAEIGFHAMSIIENGARTETHAADIDLRQWLTGLGYALDTTATIVNIGAASIRWFNAVELRANGIPTEQYPYSGGTAPRRRIVRPPSRGSVAFLQHITAGRPWHAGYAQISAHCIGWIVISCQTARLHRASITSCLTNFPA